MKASEMAVQMDLLLPVSLRRSVGEWEEVSNED